MAAVQYVLAHLDFGGKGEVRNVVLGGSATRPASPLAGAIFYNTAASRVEYFDGTTWQTLAAEVFTESAHDAHDHSAVASTIALNEIGEPTGAVSFAGQRITNVGTPSDSGDAANKSYVDTVVSDEAAARAAAVAAEAAARAADVAALNQTITAEVAALEAADTALDGRLDAVETTLASLDAGYVTEAELAAAIAAEQLAWSTADAAVLAEVTEADLAIAAEETRATAAEAALDARLLAVESDISALDETYATDADLAATNAEVAYLNGEVNVAFGNIQALDDNLSPRVSALETEAASLDSRLTTVENEIPSLATTNYVDTRFTTEGQLANQYADNAATAAFNNAVAAANAYTDSVAQGLDIKASVRVIHGEDPTLTAQDLTGLLTIDGVELAAGDRVLVVSSAGGAADGIWVVSEGAWSRASDADDPSKLNLGAYVYVEAGSSAGTGWVLVDDPAPGWPDYWSIFNGPNAYAAGAGLSSNGTTFSVVLAPDHGLEFTGNYDGWSGIGLNPEATRAHIGATTKVAQTIGNGSATSFEIFHSLGADVVVSVRDAATGEVVLCGTTISATSVTVEFVSAPAQDAYRVVIVG